MIHWFVYAAVLAYFSSDGQILRDFLRSAFLSGSVLISYYATYQLK